MLEVDNSILLREEKHYEEFHIDDLDNETIKEINNDIIKSETENKRYSDVLKLKNLKFKDSGVDLPNILSEYEEKNSKPKEIIPQFYFPKGNKYSNISNEEYFNQIKKKVKSIFNNKSLNETEFNNVTNKCNLPKYLNGALFRKVLKYAKNKREMEIIDSYDTDDNSTVVGDENISSNIKHQLSSKKLNSKKNTKKKIPLKLIQLENKLKELKQFNLENCTIPNDSVVCFEDFIEYWESIAKDSQDVYYISFYILKDEENTDKLRNYLDYLVPSDFMVVLNDVVKYHPGLKFLINMPIFQQRYSESVIEQLFYHKPQNWNRKMTLSEFRSSNFLENLLYLQIDDDINIHRNLFSYKHFYVIYCKFWELDSDHDLLINCYSLFQYDRYSLNTLIIERIIKGYGKKTLLNELNFNHMSNDITYTEYSNTIRKNITSDKTLKNSNIYQYQSIFHFRDFIWFMLARENKDSPEAIEYWFRCIDLDDDGYISIYEIEKFYIEQCKHMVLLHISDYWTFPDYLCYLLDMIKPKIPNMISLSDLKKSKNSTTFFNMLFDIRQFESLSKKADYFGYFDEIWIRESVPLNSLTEFFKDFKIKLRKRKLNNWEKYAEKMYDYLANEEVQNEQKSVSQVRKKSYSSEKSSRKKSKSEKKLAIEELDVIESADLLNKNDDIFEDDNISYYNDDYD
ncbi:hypothetical protein BCR32DRAFT_266093 [Anaeromyces robustus]|uniref:EF-hand domain-containing protein n=1 Tax=Anaeromyces robustus TaxID=1754192 RepID=A0A1Y1XH75_9FUNG|nr:hypothetical protein BCR32DRAFT_266093 [Anaeromyces robustus]|eukprot:ORX84734.1 hypothetical protein BCR32DRAFT_266093 [Anaeromyces robustus]